MNMKKKRVTAFVLVVCMAGLFTACGGKEKTPEEQFSDTLNSTYNNIKDWESSYISENSYRTSSIYEESSEPSEVSKPEEKIDPFENLQITYTGTSPYISVSFDTTECSDIVGENVTFTTEEGYLKNGDTFTVTASLENKTSDKNIVLRTETKKYKVENQPEFITSVKDLDLKEMKTEIDDKLASVTAANKGDGHFAGVSLGAGFGSGNFESVASSKLKSTYLISLKKSFEDKYTNDKKVYNRYMQMYEYVVNRKNTDPQKVYVTVYVNNILRNPDGTLSWDLEIGSKGYTDYDSMVNDYVTSNRQYYNVTEVKS